MNPIHEHNIITKRLAKSLKRDGIYDWLIRYGYFPESYVLPPCFHVLKCPDKRKSYFKVVTTKKGTDYKVDVCELIKVHFPKTDLTDRVFGIMDPYIHNDIAYNISRNWDSIIGSIFHKDNKVVSYSFPLPIDVKCPGRVGHLRSGRMIYEFLAMTDEDLAAYAYKYSHIIKADVKNFYPSIYTHSLSWAIHGKKHIRKSKNRHDYHKVGNRLDRLFQYANDGCTNGIAIGPVVSDLAAEIVCSGVDRIFSRQIDKCGMDIQAVRFKDDYRILVKSEHEGRKAIKLLQSSLKEYNLELSDEKTTISNLPEGLFRAWVSKYQSAMGFKPKVYSWKKFRELYLSVVRIDKECPGTGVIDRFLADVTQKNGIPKVQYGKDNLQLIISMLLMMGTLRVKSFPKVLAILEAIIKSSVGVNHRGDIEEYIADFLLSLSCDEERNKYLISWLSYFVVANRIALPNGKRPQFKDPITRSIFNNRATIFKNRTDFILFRGVNKSARSVSLVKHLDIFNPPKAI